MAKEFYYALAFTSGLFIAVQAGINSQLRIALQHPILAALVSFVVGGLFLLVFFIFSAKTGISVSSITAISGWKFLGGILGAIYIFVMIIIAPKIGAANSLGFAIAGQLLCAVVLDHFGWVGFPIREISWVRISGVALIILGIYLVQRK
ncbi:MAG: DMT family transporter [Bacteroidetes bacterium]|nr:DMT family transporter [Bacteroidota bacterium]